MYIIYSPQEILMELLTIYNHIILIIITKINYLVHSIIKYINNLEIDLLMRKVNRNLRN